MAISSSFCNQITLLLDLSNDVFIQSSTFDQIEGFLTENRSKIALDTSLTIPLNDLANRILIIGFHTTDLNDKVFSIVKKIRGIVELNEALHQWINNHTNCEIEKKQALANFIMNNWICQSEFFSLQTEKFTELPACIGKLNHLQILTLSENEFTEIPDAIGKLSKLERLDLEYNKLTCLPNTLGQLTQLKELFLNNNNLEYMPESIGLLTMLKRLHLQQNKLKCLPDSIGELKDLQELDVSYNKLVSIPNTIGQLTNLSVFVVDNTFTHLPDSIGKLTKCFLYRDTNAELQLPGQLTML